MDQNGKNKRKRKSNGKDEKCVVKKPQTREYAELESLFGEFGTVLGDALLPLSVSLVKMIAEYSWNRAYLLAEVEGRIHQNGWIIMTVNWLPSILYIESASIPNWYDPSTMDVLRGCTLRQDHCIAKHGRVREALRSWRTPFDEAVEKYLKAQRRFQREGDQIMYILPSGRQLQTWFRWYELHTNETVDTKFAMSRV